jgi:flagellar hook assembly protein FlgD
MKVRTLENHQASKGDSGKFYWDGTNQDGNKLPAGMYLVRMTIDGKEVETMKIAIK